MFRTEPGSTKITPVATAEVHRCTEHVDVTRVRSDVEALAQPRNRLADAEGMRRAETYAAASLHDSGWEVERLPFVADDFELPADPGGASDDRMLSYRGVEGANLLARRGEKRDGPMLLVGAHLDTVQGGPGADDNASGVAAVLELARVLAPTKLCGNVLLALFDMEEVGCFGSRALVRELARENLPTAALVFESIGFTNHIPGSQRLPPGIGTIYRKQVRKITRRRYVGDWTLIIYKQSSATVAQSFAESLAYVEGRDGVLSVRDPLDLPLLGTLLARAAPWTRQFARSDHISFWASGVPAIQITDTANFRNPNYHTPTDLPETLDYPCIAAVVTATAATIAGLVDESADR